MSLIFSSTEWITAAYLYYRRVDDRDPRYSIFLASVAFMESSQGLLWFFALEGDGAIQLRCNYIFSGFIWLAAWILIPLSIINFVQDVSNGHTSVGDYERISSFVKPNGWDRKQRFASYFLAQGVFVLGLQAWTGTWQTKKGAHHHQVWTCAGALEHLGEFFVPESVAHLFCLALCFLYVAVLAWALLPLRPRWERNGFLLIGIVTFCYLYYFFSHSLEACSVWCWSVFVYLLLYISRPCLPAFWQRLCPSE